MPLKKLHLGDLLLQNGVITQNQLNQALAEQSKIGRKLGDVLVMLGYVKEADLLEFLSRQLQIPLVSLRSYKIDAEAVKLLPESLARRYHALVLSKNEREAVVAISDPTDLIALDEVSRLARQPVKLVLVREQELLDAMDQLYRQTEQIAELAERIEDELGETAFDLNAMADSTDIADAPVVKLLQSLFEDAVQMRASDIHIEPGESVLRIRQRVDGVLEEHILNENRAATALISRLKLLAGLNISERRLPQDGRFSVRVRDRKIDVRLSTMPVQYGESVVMRLLDRSTGLLRLEQLGMPAELMTRFRHNIHLSYGMVLVTGPTGSGKTTTLYAALNELNSATKNIVTVEDPVEYTLPRINQVQVRPAIGLTFANVLRSALRQDPDIVMVGEMRDAETAEIALRAALTGHLVLSTLHTNGAVATASRLLDMGADGYLVAAALRAVVAQRLVRRVCGDCARPQPVPPAERTAVEAAFGVPLEDGTYRIGEGCHRCGNTGYHGRIGVYELLEMDAAMLDALRGNDTAAFNAAAERAEGFRPLALCALDYARQGWTSLAEVLRILGEGE